MPDRPGGVLLGHDNALGWCVRTYHGPNLRVDVDAYSTLSGAAASCTPLSPVDAARTTCLALICELEMSGGCRMYDRLFKFIHMNRNSYGSMSNTT